MAMLFNQRAQAITINVDFNAPPWHAERGLILPKSQSRLAPIPGSFAVIGHAVLSEQEREGRKVDTHLEVELLTLDNVETTFSYSNVGYIFTRDWNEVDVKELIAKVQKKWQARDKDTFPSGQPHVASISNRLMAPYYDERSQTVLLVLSGIQTDRTKFWNGMALKLGRFGYEAIEMNGPIVPLSTQSSVCRRLLPNLVSMKNRDKKIVLQGLTV